MKRYAQDQKRLTEIQALTYALHQQMNQGENEGENVGESDSPPVVQSIPISQMTTIGRKGDYRLEVEDNNLFPIGSLVVQ